MGLIHIYCGDGQGKTTASIGMMIRGAGYGMKVHFLQLLKGNETSEIASLRHIPNITIARLDMDYGFTFNMSDEEKIAVSRCHNRLLTNAFEMAKNSEIDMLVIDEFNGAYETNLLDKALVDDFIFNKPANLELILTGRHPAEKFVKISDYVSEILPIKHPFSRGITARKGIEY